MYGWSGICGELGLCSFMFSFVTSSKLIIFWIVLLYWYIQSLIFHSLDYFSFHINMLLSNQLTAFFYHHLNLKQSYWFFSVKILCFSLLNLCFVFDINLLFLINSLFSFVAKETLYVNLFVDGLLYSQVELLLNSFYNFQIWVFFLWHNFFVPFAILSSLLSSIKDILKAFKNFKNKEKNCIK